MTEPLEHHGVKGMHWGERKAEVKDQIDQYKTRQLQKIGHRAVREVETTATFIGLAALGVAFARSPRAQKMMKVPTMAAVHYLADSNHRRKVAKVLKASYIVYQDI